MIQRRKTTTYGKVLRKPISDFSAFAQASESGTEHIYQTHNGVEAPTTKSPALKLVQRSASSTSPCNSDGTVSAELQSPTGCSQSKARSNVVLYDFPFSDEDDGRSASTSDTGSRKRRKLTPMNDEPLPSVVFDDDSLQRHIAAEVRMESSIAIDVKRKAAIAPKIPLTYVRGKSEALKQKKPSPVNIRDPTSRSRPRLNATCSPKTTKLETSDFKQPISPKYHDSRMPMQNHPSRKTQGIKKSSAQPTRNLHTPPRNDAVPVLPAMVQSESKQSQIEQGNLPSTPSRPRNSGGVATTPKQRELWSKLLSCDTQTASPSTLDIPGLRIGDQKAQPENPFLHPRISGRAASMGTGKRSTRLVDFLVTSDRDRSPATVESSEDNESSGAGPSKSVESEISINDDILTTQILPRAGNQSRPLQIHDAGLVHSSQPMSSLQEAPRVTYIRERTHLGDDDLSDASLLNIPLVPEPGISRKRQWGASDVEQGKMDSEKDIFDDLDDVQDFQGGAMRSIHELREAGGNTRIVGELEAILDDLDERLDSSTSARRSSLMSLTSKLLEASTCRMLVGQGLEPRLLALVNLSHDIIERSLLAIGILQILLHTPSAAFLSQTNQVRTTNFLVGLLSHSQDLAKQAKLRETNMSKLAQSEYSNLCSSFLRSPVWRSLKPTVLSGQVLALQALELLVRQAREAGSLADILSANAISCIAQNAIPSAEALQLPATSSSICLQLAVSILESITVNGAADVRISEWTDTTFEHICDIFPLIADASGLEFGYLRTLTLRLYLNLTNTNPTLCDIFSKPPLVSMVFKNMCMQFSRLSEPDAQDQDLLLLDNLILSLGCLINLAESSDTMRQLAVDLKTPEGSFLEALLQLFLKKRGKAAEALSEEEAGNNVAFGYLSVLLSYLCINDAVRSYVNARPEGPTLAVLLDAVEEFLNYHRQIDDSTVSEDRGRDRRANFVDRLQGIIDDLRSSG